MLKPVALIHKLTIGGVSVVILPYKWSSTSQREHHSSVCDSPVHFAAMEAKRPASDRVDEPAAKGRLSFPLRYKDLVMDLGEEGSLDLTPALDLHPQVFAASPSSNQAEPKTPIPPREVYAKNFPIIKNGMKYFKIDVDINSFTPFVSLVSETSKTIQLSNKELHDLVSEETFNMVLKNFESKKTKPVELGDVLVSIKAYATTNNVCTKKNNIKVYFAMSSWKFFQRIKQMLKIYLSQCETQCFYCTSNFVPLLTQARNFCLPLLEKIAKMSESDIFTTLINAFDVPNIFFPEEIKQEMLAYHLEFLTDTL
ncbi:Angelicin synthase, partial [Frankliniella fusca]